MRLVVVDGRMFAGTLVGTSEKARTDRRTDYEALEYGTTTVPAKAAETGRDGHDIGASPPIAPKRASVPRGEFVARSRTARGISLDAFRADQDATPEQRHGDRASTVVRE
ncbi:prevent-host-death protein [Streptomyces sp. NPDC052042]|uniref:prevent-host-death protein n=1 Tax=Streptomyces sp. NPDC052042 TaxID=3365683 RepID=UPI0037D36101